MLTDEEIQSVYSEFLDVKGSAMEFARRIERAVLAKAGEQEPICKIIKSSECGGIDFYFDKIPDGETMLYSHPLPAQAIPEGWKEDWKKNVMQLWMCARKHDSSIPDDQLDYMREMLLSASLKP